MDADRLRDMISRGMGNAARVIGDDYEVFRTRSSADPLMSGNLIMRLPVIRPGDYLRGPRGVLFVAALPPMERALCVLTNAVIDVLRPSGPNNAGLNGYGGIIDEGLEVVLSGWPVQVTVLSGGGQGALPADGGRSSSSVLFPVTPAAIKASDLLQDDAGTRYVVKTSEASEMGWHLAVAGTEV
jgi:hypothetical protein